MSVDGSHECFCGRECKGKAAWESALRDAYEQGEKAGLNVNVSPMVHEAYLKGAEQMRERAAKLMEEYGCTACNHFSHDASPNLLRDIPLVEEEARK